jgi:tetrahydromethanopterin S-methyltransferase subunit C
VTADQRVYASLVRLYPRQFRLDFADEMILAFGELIEHDGRAATWRRVFVDLVVTVPTYRLETIMAPQRSTTALVALVAALAVGAAAAFAVGVWPVAAILLVVAMVIGVTERSHLARSLRPATPLHRRRLLARSAALGLIAVAVLVIGLFDLGDESHWPADRLLLYNALFLGAVVAAFAHLAVALRHPDGIAKLTSTVDPA